MDWQSFLGSLVYLVIIGGSIAGMHYGLVDGMFGYAVIGAALTHFGIKVTPNGLATSLFGKSPPPAPQPTVEELPLVDRPTASVPVVPGGLAKGPQSQQ